MTPPDVILIDMPVLLRSILREAVLDAGMAVRSEHETLSGALAALPKQPNVAIVGSAELIDRPAVEVLQSRLPYARVIVIGADGLGATLFAPGRPSTPLHDVSPSALAAALRSDTC